MNFKYIFCLILTLLISQLSFAQVALQDVVYLKNGSVLRGIITKEIPNKSIKLRMADGYEMEYAIKDILKMTKEESIAEPQNNEIPTKSKKTATNLRKGPHFGLISSVNYQITASENQFKSVAAADYVTVKGIITENAGFNISYFFDEHVGFSAGLGFAMYGRAYEGNGRYKSYKQYTYFAQSSTQQYGYNYFDLNFKGKTKLYYLNIPVELKFMTSKPQKVGFYLNVGASLGILFARKTTLVGTNLQYPFNLPNTNPTPYSFSVVYPETRLDNIITTKNDFADKNTTVHLGMGISIPLSKVAYMTLGPRIEVGVVDINNRNRDQYYKGLFGEELTSYTPMQTKALGLEVGFHFKLPE
jgi:hypothetical protein